MGSSRFVRPDTRILTLANGDTLTVKRRLSAYESRIMRGMKAVATLAEPAVVMAYLVDWSLTDEDGKRVLIAGVTSSVLASVIDALDEDDFDEIHTAITAHVAEMAAERTAAKKKTIPGDVPISALPSAAAGASSGFVN